MLNQGDSVTRAPTGPYKGSRTRDSEYKILPSFRNYFPSVHLTRISNLTKSNNLQLISSLYNSYQYFFNPGREVRDRVTIFDFEAFF